MAFNQQMQMPYTQVLQNYDTQPIQQVNMPNNMYYSQPWSNQQQQYQQQYQQQSQQQIPFHNFPSQTRTREEEWQTVQYDNKKRRRSPDNPDTTNDKSKYWLGNPITTANRYNVLSANEDMEQSSTTTTNEEPKPPPIFVTRVTNIKPLTELLVSLVKDKYSLKTISQDQIKIQLETRETYTATCKALQERNTEFYTYKPKQDRSFRVVLKNFHPSSELEPLKNELQQLGHQVINIWNIKHRVTKSPLSMFFIDLQTKENNKEIYDIKLLQNCVVQFHNRALTEL